MAQFSGLLEDGGPRGQEEEEAEETEKTQLDTEGDLFWTLGLFFRKPLGSSAREQSLTLHSAASVLDLALTPAQELQTLLPPLRMLSQTPDSSALASQPRSTHLKQSSHSL